MSPKQSEGCDPYQQLFSGLIDSLKNLRYLLLVIFVNRNLPQDRLPLETSQFIRFALQSSVQVFSHQFMFEK